jgi:alkanesulfonate monooxygenase SsuD/methylene tetrahydromethanopterin reductase-like flavin-dependent oxidoreductase (luciferase family)
MLRITVPHVQMWNAWLCSERSNADEVPAHRELVDAACRDAGRNPATLERTVSIQVDPTGTGTIPLSMAPDTATPLSGSPQEIAAGIRDFAKQGITHLQVALVPNTIETIEIFGTVLDELDR